ncbi:MAG TPA: hypothetical protein VLN42_05835, partial [Casimicrobiaceae bacterium]|nr:hypothetical protein [Casimicrobiaceae bacterium]
MNVCICYLRDRAMPFRQGKELRRGAPIVHTIGPFCAICVTVDSKQSGSRMSKVEDALPIVQRALWFAAALCAMAGPAIAAEPAPLPWTAAARESATPLRLAADAAPSSREALFGDDKPADSAPSIPPSREELFGEAPERRAPSAAPAW